MSVSLIIDQNFIPHPPLNTDFRTTVGKGKETEIPPVSKRSVGK